MTEDAYAPPIRWWGHVWRYALMLMLSAIVWLPVVGTQWDERRGFFVADLVLGVASYVLVAFRRRWPLPVAIVLNVMSVVSGIAGGPAVLASVSVATRRVVWQVVLVGAVGVAASQVYSVLQPVQGDTWWITLGFGTAVTVAMLATGMYVGSRRELLWTLKERALSAEQQQELRLEAARAAERERIAREMHDVLAHRISMVSMHAGALAYRTDLPPEQVRETAALIQSTAHQALTDLRQVLGVLRDDTGAVRERPQPTLGDLSELVTEARAAGMRVDLDLTLGADAGVPDPVGRTVYRIVQEGLTNARKHALGAAVRVQVTGSAGPGVDVRVRNDVRPGRSTTPGSGLGLVGLRERTELAGGRLDVRTEAGTFALHGWLPWPT